MKIAFVVPYPPGVAASQRFRFEQYLSFLSEEGHDIRVYSFLSVPAWLLIYRQDQFLKKIFYTLVGFLRRAMHLFQVLPADCVFIHREASPFGPPLFEWFTKFILRKRIIYDFDDAIWLADSASTGDGIQSLKNPSKVLRIAKWSYRLSVGNDYLFDFISAYNSNVTLNPTTIDLSYHKPLAKNHDGSPLRLGWTGTHSTMKYLNDIMPVLMELQNGLEFELDVISNTPPEFQFSWVRYIKWNKATEIQDLSSFDVGLMPLRNDEWSKGKCGFKLLQYMALEIPSVASPVGVNASILTNSDAGKSCISALEWKEALLSLIENKELRLEMGKRGRTFVENNYSVTSNRSNFLSLFDKE